MGMHPNDLHDLSTTPVQIACGGAITAQCMTGDWYVGGHGLTADNGILILKGEKYYVELKPNELLFAVAAKKQVLRVMHTRV